MSQGQNNNGYVLLWKEGLFEPGHNSCVIAAWEHHINGDVVFVKKDRGHCACKSNAGSFGGGVLREYWAGEDTNSAGGEDDFPSWYRIVSHEMRGEYHAVDGALVVDLCAR